MSYRVGIDVGGTNTDAVVLDESDSLIAKTKTPTTEDVTSGIVTALEEVISDNFDESTVDSVMLGTTHCTNAVTERKKLNQVGVIRIGAPATLAIRPLLEWPDDLADAIGNHTSIVEGGHEFNGDLITDLDEEAVREFCRKKSELVDSIAVTSVFSPVRDDHEERVAEIVRDELGEETPISLSSEIGSVGLLERENATILNASLTSVIREASSAFRAAMEKHDLDAHLYFGQNDGTLMSVDYAERYPIFTVACGPANSIRGAAYLSGMQDGIITDVGGTTTDVGALSDGFPRESAVAVEIGGVKTNFRMPDLISIGLGGGSIVRDEDSEVTVGPDSVGYEIVSKARVFGGDVTTATDVALELGRGSFGTTNANLSDELVDAASDVIVERVERKIDEMKTNAGDVPVAVVGGGSILLPGELEGASEVDKPENYEVANAIGAAIAQVSGHIDRVFSLDEQPREDALEEAKSFARESAIEAGADPDTIEIVDIEEVPLSYLPGNAVRFSIQAAGDLLVSETAEDI
jgi:N-methylhydantoinase A/oxoprolinase/acetone carboxylase beta subunit